MQADPNTIQIIDINWKKSELYYPAITLYNIFTKEVSTHNLNSFELNLMLSENRYCFGYFSSGKRYPCIRDKGCPVLLDNSEKQCLACERAEGFKDAFIFGKTPNENAKEYLSQEHFLYLAYFAPDIIKVGTTSSLRKEIRLIEQDALVYAFIAKTDGFNIQTLEHAISKNIKLPEFVSTRHKYKFLSLKPNIANVEFRIQSLFRAIKEYYKTTKFSDWLEKEEIDIVDLNRSANIFFPEKIDYYLHSASHLTGEFLGIRGKILILSNYDNIIAINKNSVIGKRIIGVSQNSYDIIPTQNNDQLTIF